MRGVKLGFQTRSWDNASQLLQEEIAYDETVTADRFSSDIDSQRVAGPGYKWVLGRANCGCPRRLVEKYELSSEY